MTTQPLLWPASLSEPSLPGPSGGLARVILADPPWAYADRRETRRDNPGRKPKFGLGVERRYSAGTMCTAELCALGLLVQAASTRDAYLFMWATCPLLPIALEVMEAWGFRYATTAHLWVKQNPRGSLFRGPGRYTPSNAEPVLLGVRGRPWHPSTGSKPPQVLIAPHPRLGGKIIHSRKPGQIHEQIETWLGPHLAGGSLLEIFATQRRPGWTCLGHAVTGRDIRDDLAELAADLLAAPVGDAR